MTASYENEYPVNPSQAIRDILANTKMAAHCNDLGYLSDAITSIDEDPLAFDTMPVASLVISLLQRSDVEDNVYTLELVKVLRYAFQIDQARLSESRYMKR